MQTLIVYQTSWIIILSDVSPNAHHLVFSVSDQSANRCNNNLQFNIISICASNPECDPNLIAIDPIS